MIAKADSPEPEFPLPSAKCLFCKKEGVKGGGVGYVICDLFRYELMQYKAVQFEEYSMCFKCGSVINYVVYIKRLLLTTLFGLPVEPPIFTRELPDIAKNLNENVRFILHCNIPHHVESSIPNAPISSARKNGSKSSSHLKIQEPIRQDDSPEDMEPLLIETCSTYEEPANIGYHRYNDDRVRAQSEPRTRSRANVTPKRPKSQLSRSRSKSQAKQLVCKWLNCRLVCQSQRKLSIHYEDEHQYDCLICNQCSFGTRHFLEKHKKENHDRKCKLCKIGIKPDEFRSHCREPHNFQCPYCDMKFHKYKHLSGHTRTKHEKRPILELYTSARFQTDTDESLTTDIYEETEIIILNNNNTQALMTLSKLEQYPSVQSIENTADINESLNEDTVTRENNTELCSTDSGVDTEQEISQSLEGDLTTINTASSVTEEISINNADIDSENRTSPTINQNLESNATATESISPEPTVLVSAEPPILDEFETSGSALFDPPPALPPILTVSSSCVIPVIRTVASSESRNRDNLQGQLSMNTRSSRRRRLNSVYYHVTQNPTIKLAPSSKDSEPSSKDSEPSYNQEESNDNRDIKIPDQPRSDIKSARGLRKRNAPPADIVREFIKPRNSSIMNTRSRDRSHAKQSTADNKNTLALIQDDDDETSGTNSKKARYDTIIEGGSYTSGPIDQKSELGNTAKAKVDERNIDEDLLYHMVNKKLSKRSTKKSVHTDDTFTYNSKEIDINVDQNVQVNVDKEPVDNFLKNLERNCDMVESTKNTIDNTSENKEVEASGVVQNEPTYSPAVNTIETSDQSNAALIENKTNTSISDLNDLRNKSELIYNLPGFYTELVSDNTPEKDAQVKTTNISIISDKFDNSTNHINLGETRIDSLDRLQAVVVRNIINTRLEDYESNDSASSCTSLTIIHEEDFSYEEEVVHPKTKASDPVSVDKRDCIQSEITSNLNSIKTSSNMDNIIESVAKATNVISKTKGLAKKLSKSKNVKSDYSPSKAVKSDGDKITIGKSGKLLAKSTKSHSSPSSVRKNTKIPSDGTTIRDANTNSDMNSLARYMMSKLDREISINKSNSAGSSIPHDSSPISIYKKPGANKMGNVSRIDIADNNTISSIQKPNAKVTPDFTFTNDAAFKVIGSLSKTKIKSPTIKKRGRNKKERSDRRAINFDEFIFDRETSSITIPQSESGPPTDRIPKPDAYAFPETENPHESFNPQNAHVESDADTSKTASNHKQKIDNIEPPVKKKSRVKSKPRKNTAFDNIITEASQRYYRK